MCAVGFPLTVAESYCRDGRLASRIRLALLVYERSFLQVFNSEHFQLSQGCGSHTLGAADGRFLERCSDEGL